MCAGERPGEAPQLDVLDGRWRWERGAYKTQTTGGLGFPFVAVIMRDGVGVRDRGGDVECFDRRRLTDSQTMDGELRCAHSIRLFI